MCVTCVNGNFSNVRMAIAAPRDVYIVDGNSGLRMNSISGSAEEKSNLTLKCIASDGESTDTLFWKRMRDSVLPLLSFRPGERSI